MKKLPFIVLLLTFLIVATSGVRDINSNAAPLGSTGAPGENSCAKSTCHVGSAVNSGSAFMNIQFSNNDASYMPDAVYDVTVSLQQTEIERFGFQLLALNSNNENAGTLLITDNDRTQTQEGIGPYEGRNYVTYKYAGTEPYSPGLGQWSFQWKAPASYQGDITFYAATVAANNDATDYGDTVYTKQFSIQQAVTGIQETSSNQLSVSVYPNPVQEYLNVEYQTTEPSNTAIELTDLLSRDTYFSIQRLDDIGKQEARMDVSKLPTGIYLVWLTANNKTQTRKVFIN